VETEKQNSLEDTTVLGYFPPLSTPGTTTVGNAPGKSSYAKVTGKPSGKKLNFHTLFTPRGNGIDVVVPVESIRAINERFANTTYSFSWERRWHTLLLLTMLGTLGVNMGLFILSSARLWIILFQFSSMDGLDAMLENGLWFIQNNPLILKKWHSDENPMKEDISTGRSSYARAIIELRTDVELKDNIIVAMPKLTGEGHYICNVRVEYEWKPPRCASCKVFGHIHEECPKNTGVGEKKTLKKPSQTSRGVLVGQKIGLKSQKEYRSVPKKPTASSSGNKKKGVVPTIKVSNSNLFEVLNSIDNDVEYMDDYDSEDEVVSVNNNMARSMASERVGFGTQSLLEQWRDSYGNRDYDEDPYDDDMYEGQDLSQELQAICDNLDIRV
ncbi:retrotransposon protein, putative, ty1-copia subclass, partial [Tanacetum coccineum]